MAGTVHLDVTDGIATVELDHTERRNALTVAMWERLGEIGDELLRRSDVRVVVVRGRGEVAFASGADISEFGDTRSDADKNRAYDALVARATSALAALDRPVVAAVHGFCLGGGLAVALACDLRIVADDASFAIPAARLGVGYNAPGVATLVGLVGPSATKRLIFTGDRVDARDALTMGLVDEVVPKAELDDRIDALVSRLRANAPLTMAAAKAAVRELLRPESDQDMARVRRTIEACFDSDDFAEGVRAFMAKDTPNFRGR